MFIHAMVIINIIKTPIPNMRPNSLVSLIFVKHREKNPIDVVKLVKKSAPPILLITERNDVIFDSCKNNPS